MYFSVMAEGKKRYSGEMPQALYDAIQGLAHKECRSFNSMLQQLAIRAGVKYKGMPTKPTVRIVKAN